MIPQTRNQSLDSVGGNTVEGDDTMALDLTLRKGARIRHTSRPEWGVGQLLEDATSQELRIFFEQKGEVCFSPDAAKKLAVVEGTEAFSLLLDNLYLPGPGASRPMVTIAQAKLRLLEMFPGGLHGQKMAEKERTYKDSLRQMCEGWCCAENLNKLVETGQYEAVFELAHRLVKHSANNFPSHFEKMAFRDGAKAHNRQREFAEAFCAWVLPEQPTQATFEAFAAELDHLGCAKWPILTPFRFLLHPQTDALIKPENLRKAAELARFEINYRSELNWLTYHSVLSFYRYVRHAISDLDPMDNIDVQNFIWCIDPDQYPE